MQDRRDPLITAPLVHLAADPAKSRGREFLADGAPIRGPRTAFQRDRDRIIHSISFRRLRHKTQVFVAPDDDHYRVRLTHSLEVAQIARVLARALGLNEDLTEALALAHDIGHPPFGHAGEEALKAALAPHGGWDHNAHGLRVLMRLESPYCEHDGLNLSWEVLEGMAKHNGPVTALPWALAELDAAYPLDLREWSGLEAQVAALADDIAYDNHDVDDGLRAGFLDFDELLGLPLVERHWREVCRRFPLAARHRQLRELVRCMIGAMVNDVLAETVRRAKGLAGPADVRTAGGATAGFSQAMAGEERALKRHLYDKLYYHPAQLAAASAAEEVIAGLFAAFAETPARMGGDWAARLPAAEPARARHIADFIAGMTDRYAIAQWTKLTGHAPAGLAKV